MSMAANISLIGLRAHSTGGKSCLAIGIQPGSWGLVWSGCQKRVCYCHSLDQIIPYYSLSLILRPTNKCIYHPLSNKPRLFFFSEQRPMTGYNVEIPGSWSPNPTESNYTTAPESMAQETSQKREAKSDVKVSTRNGCSNNPGPIIISMGMLR